MGEHFAKRFFKSILNLLMNQRGEISEEDPNELSAEEQAIIDGGEEPESGAGESGEADPPGGGEIEESASETETDPGEEEGRIPYDRFKAVNDERNALKDKVKELENKSNEVQPEEQEEQSSEAPASPASGLGSMVVKGGEHDGKTWNEVYHADPATALEIRDAHLGDIKAEKDAADKAQIDREAEAEAEITAFIEYQAQELYQKKTGGLTAEEISAINLGIQEDIAWGAETGRGHGKISDIHFLRNRENDLVKAKSSGAEGLVKSISNGSVASISSGKGEGSVSGYDADMGMSRGAMADKLENMSDAAFTEWKADAPEAVKTKFRDLF